MTETFARSSRCAFILVAAILAAYTNAPNRQALGKMTPGSMLNSFKS